jgi:hypothetical protein
MAVKWYDDDIIKDVELKNRRRAPGSDSFEFDTGLSEAGDLSALQGMVAGTSATASEANTGSAIKPNVLDPATWADGFGAVISGQTTGNPFGQLDGSNSGVAGGVQGGTPGGKLGGSMSGNSLSGAGGRNPLSEAVLAKKDAQLGLSAKPQQRPQETIESLEELAFSPNQKPTSMVEDTLKMPYESQEEFGLPVR